MAKRSKHRSRVTAVTPSVPRHSVGKVVHSYVPSPPLILPAPLYKKPVQPARLHSDNSRISRVAARLSQHLQRVAALPSIAEKHKRNSKLSFAPAITEPDGRKSSKKARDVPHCKKRPDSKRAARGKGGSKRFVPWCG